MAGDSRADPAVPVFEAKGLTYCYDGTSVKTDLTGIQKACASEPKLIDVNCSFGQGSRVLVVGANGAGKSTLLSIMGGKKMAPSDACRIFGKRAFDSSLDRERMYCGDWWRSDFFFNITVVELIGEAVLATARVQTLIDIMQINVSWRINAISDGQRRRCQLLESLAEEKSVYILDEITTDLDLYAREGLLRFLRRESEERGATIFYATHIFDHLAEWATHILCISHARVSRSCSMEELSEYHALVAEGIRCPLYTLMRTWVSNDYDAMALLAADESPMAKTVEKPVIEAHNLDYAYDGGSLELKQISFSFGRGARIIVVGVNGAGKSTLLSILGGKRMVRRGLASILGYDCFNDPAVSQDVMYVGDWWRTRLLMNPTIFELLGDARETPRCKNLVGILRVDLDWRINELSDGQRRRCQLLEILSVPRSVYLMDEITSDLDLVIRENILAFLRGECENRGATIVYCTHIFDHLEGWATHLLHLSEGSVVRACGLDEVEEYKQLIDERNATPLYSLVRKWVYAEYDGSSVEKWRKLDPSLDGRRPNLGLAGPMQTHSG